MKRVKDAAGIHFSSFRDEKDSIDPEIRDKVEVTDENRMLGGQKPDPKFIRELKRARGVE